MCDKKKNYKRNFYDIYNKLYIYCSNKMFQHIRQAEMRELLCGIKK